MPTGVALSDYDLSLPVIAPTDLAALGVRVAARLVRSCSAMQKNVVFLILAYHQIVRRVIGRVLVDMVHHRAFGKRVAEGAFGDQNVLQDVTSSPVLPRVAVGDHRNVSASVCPSPETRFDAPPSGGMAAHKLGRLAFDVADFSVGHSRDRGQFSAAAFAQFWIVRHSRNLTRLSRRQKCTALVAKSCTVPVLIVGGLSLAGGYLLHR